MQHASLKLQHLMSCKMFWWQGIARRSVALSFVWISAKPHMMIDIDWPVEEKLMFGCICMHVSEQLAMIIE